jgi:hypothetical protein
MAYAINRVKPVSGELLFRQPADRNVTMLQGVENPLNESFAVPQYWDGAATAPVSAYRNREGAHGPDILVATIKLEPGPNIVAMDNLRPATSLNLHRSLAASEASLCNTSRKPRPHDHKVCGCLWRSLPGCIHINFHLVVSRKHHFVICIGDDRVIDVWVLTGQRP